jgi:hypothetical protein
MSDPATPVDYASPDVATPRSTSPILQLGGLLGLGGTLAGLVILLAGCGGARWFAASVFVAGAGAVGFLLSLLGALAQRRRITEETHVLIAFFANFLAIAGGLLEMAVWKGWPLLPK